MLVVQFLIVLAITVYAVEGSSSSGVFSEDDFKKMSVKKLRAFIAERGSDCALCTEKQEFIQMALELKDKEPMKETKTEDKKKFKKEEKKPSTKKDSKGKKNSKASPLGDDAAEKFSQFQSGGFSPNGDGAGTSSWSNPLDEKMKKKTAKEKKSESKKPDRKEKKEKAKEYTKEAKKGDKNSSKKKSSDNGGSDQFDDASMDNLQDMLRQQGMNAKMFSAKDFEGMDSEEMAAKFGGGGGFGGDGPSTGSSSSFKKRSPRRPRTERPPPRETDITENNRRHTDHVDADVIEL